MVMISRWFPRKDVQKAATVALVVMVIVLTSSQIVVFDVRNNISFVRTAEQLSVSNTTNIMNIKAGGNSTINADNFPLRTNTNNDLDQNHPMSECIRRRGSKGYWYHDPIFSQKTFYTFEYRSTIWWKYKKKTFRSDDNDTSLFYPGNQYNWYDASMVSDKTMTNTITCQIHPVNYDNFCHTMKSLKIQRILFVGDSLMISQTNALLRILGYPAFETNGHNNNNNNNKKNNNGKKIMNIHCPSSDHTIYIQAVRQNLGVNLPSNRSNSFYGNEISNKQRRQFGPEILYCKDGKRGHTDTRPEHDFCPWQLEYNRSTVKTLLVLNQGAHFHSVETFTKSMESFIDRFNTISHFNDIVIFRSTVPGHYDCFNHNGAVPIPNMTHEKFLQRYGTAKYDWNLFDKYNHLARRLLGNGLDTSKVRFFNLNVYNMTVLRWDQHVKADDCLHYTHPGPIDFWNHLLFSNLADMAKLGYE